MIRPLCVTASHFVSRHFLPGIGSLPYAGLCRQKNPRFCFKARAVGATLRYLPQYSPDLNPIELVFHPLKTFLRKAAERTIERLQRCVGSYIRALDPRECMGYFRDSGD